MSAFSFAQQSVKVGNFSVPYPQSGYTTAYCVDNGTNQLHSGTITNNGTVQVSLTPTTAGKCPYYSNCGGTSTRSSDCQGVCTYLYACTTKSPLQFGSVL